MAKVILQGSGRVKKEREAHDKLVQQHRRVDWEEHGGG